MSSPFWGGFFNHFGEFGKQSMVRATLTLIGLALAGVGLAGLVDLLNLGPVLGGIPTAVYFLLGGLGFLASFVLACWKNRPPRLGRLPPLQREDLRAARSKLLKYASKK